MTPDPTPEQGASDDQGDALGESPTNEEDVPPPTGSSAEGCILGLAVLIVCTVIGLAIGSAIPAGSGYLISNEAPQGAIIGFVVGAIVGLLVWSFRSA